MKEKISNSVLLQVFSIIFLASLYFIFGRLGLILDNPSGYASPVWPAAGLALVGLLLFGFRAWPGIFIGSFLTNLASAEGVFSFDMDAISYTIPFFIASGATLQALFALFLLNRYVDIQSGLIKFKDIVLFYIFAGPVSSLISSICGVSTLYFYQIIDSGEYVYSFFTWWVGDTLGVLLVVPVVMSFFAQPQKVWKTRRINIGVSMIIIYTFIVLLFSINIKQENIRVQGIFTEQVLQINNSIEKILATDTEVIYATKNLFESSEYVSEEEFQTFLEGTLSRHPSIKAISWNPVIEYEKREEYEQQMKEKGYENFTIKEGKKGSIISAKKREKYVVVTYIEPVVGNKKAIGYDVRSNEARRYALNLAADSGKLTATSPITLVQENESQFGVLFFLPLYEEKNVAHLEKNKKKLRGYVVGVYRIGDLILQALNKFQLQELVISLEDVSDAKSITPMAIYSYDSFGKRTKLDKVSSTELDKVYTERKEILIGNRKWSLSVFATPNYVNQHRTFLGWSILLVSLIFASLVQLFLLLLTGEVEHRKVLQRNLRVANDELEERVQRRTNDLKEATQEAIEAKKIAESATKAKSEFLANMSHEIRTPMTGILGFLGQLEKEEKDPKRLKNFEIIRVSAKALLNVINDILDFSKIESGKLEIEYHPVNIHNLAENCVKIFSELAGVKNIKIENILDETTPMCIYGDEMRLQQVLYNLVNNAVKFSNENTTIRIKTEFNSQRKTLSIAVIDEGVGIAEEKIQKIFEAFSQEDISTTRRFGGTGLGLTISARLIQLMNSELKVESKVGKGSRFYFELPIEVCTQETVSKSSAILDNNEEMKEFIGNVLVVEDNKTNQMLMGMILNDSNVSFDVANDGTEAVMMYQKNEYNLILMDENMPVMNGIEATKHIREIEKEENHVPITIVAVTANALVDDREKFLEAGMNDYISKPYTEEEILRVLRQYLK